MRLAIANELRKIAKADPKLYLMTGDLGSGVFDFIQRKFPKQYTNVGISEQFMTSAAAGMALTGMTVITYSIGNFNTLRVIEQIRNDICYHNAHVIIISVGGGFAYGSGGMSHHATEDISMMRVLPNMRVFVPADAKEAVACLHEAIEHEGPAFIRLGVGGETEQYQKEESFDVNSLNFVYGEDSFCADVAIIATGPILSEAVKAAKMLEEQGNDVCVFSCPSVKPFDFETLDDIMINTKLIATVEENQMSGGLGGTVAEFLAGHNEQGAKLKRIGLMDTFTSVVGDHDYLALNYGLDAQSICDEILDNL